MMDSSWLIRIDKEELSCVAALLEIIVNIS